MRAFATGGSREMAGSLTHMSVMPAWVVSAPPWAAAYTCRKQIPRLVHIKTKPSGPNSSTIYAHMCICSCVISAQAKYNASHVGTLRDCLQLLWMMWHAWSMVPVPASDPKLHTEDMVVLHH